MVNIERTCFYSPWHSHIALRFEGRSSKKYLTESHVFHVTESPVRTRVLREVRNPVFNYVRKVFRDLCA